MGRLKTRLNKKITTKPLLALGLFASLLLPSVAFSANETIFYVNNGGDGEDSTPGDGVCSGPDDCTLRAASPEDNAFAGADSITITT